MAEIDYNVIAQEVLNILKNSGKDLSALPQASSPAGLQLAPVLKTEGGTTTAFRIDIALLKGDKGDTGLKGDRGDKGDTGSIGPQGQKGDTGATGAQGQQGIQGLKGDKGDTGAQGQQGIQGTKGDRGDTGAQGAKGDKGDTGAQGPKGDKGDGLDYATMTPEEIANITGKSAYDVAVDSGFVGTDAEWLLSLKGDTGSKGDQGEKGDKGDAGDQGIQGDKGEKGDTGEKGEQGMKGDTGGQGIQGVKGDKGDKGDAASVTEKTADLAVASWVQVSELWTYIIYDTDFKESSFVNAIPPLPTSQDFETFQDAEFFASAKANTGYVTLYAKNKPEGAIVITYVIL